jgi:hypothetical protein
VSPLLTVINLLHNTRKSKFPFLFTLFDLRQLPARIMAGVMAAERDASLADPPGDFASAEGFLTDDLNAAESPPSPKPQDIPTIFEPLPEEATPLARATHAVKSGDVGAVLALFRARHEWRAHANGAESICAVECCLRTPCVGSRFCIAHIINDPAQQYFRECPVCHRPFQANGVCFICDVQ